MAKVLVSDDSIDIRVNMFERLLLAERSRKVPLGRVRSVDAHPPIVKLVMHWADQSSVWMSGARPYEGHLVPSTRDPGRTMTIDVDEDGPLFVEVDDEPCEAVATRINEAIRRSSRPPALAETADGFLGGFALRNDDASGVTLRPQPLPRVLDAAFGLDAVGALEGACARVIVESEPAVARGTSGRSSHTPEELGRALGLVPDDDADSELVSVEPFFADSDDDDEVRRRDPLLQGSLPPPPRDQEIAQSPALDVEGLARAGFWMLGSGTVAVLTGTASVGAGVAAGLFLLGGGVTACVIGGLAIRLGASRMGS